MIDKPVITNEQLLIRFAEHLQHQDKTCHTVRAYLADVRKLVAFLEKSSMDVQLSNIPPETFNTFVEHLGDGASSDSTLKRQLMGVRQFCAFLVSSGIIEQNPLDGMSISGISTEIIPPAKLQEAFQYLSTRQQSEDQLTSLRYRRDELILLFMLFLGVRQYQVPLLRISDLRKVNGAYLLSVDSVSTPKLDAVIQHLLYVYLKCRQVQTTLLFVETFGRGSLTSTTMRALITELRHVSGTTINPKAIHHTFAHFQSNPNDAQSLLEFIEQLHRAPVSTEA